MSAAPDPVDPPPAGTGAGPPHVAVVGPGSADQGLLAAAEQLGRGIAGLGARLVCGGLGGVMEAAALGAREAGGESIGIVPGVDRREAGAACTHAVATGTGHARNLAVAATADVVVAVGGAWGTLSEVALARRLGRPVVLLDSWQLRAPSGEAEGVHQAGGVEEALKLVGTLLAPR